MALTALVKPVEPIPSAEKEMTFVHFLESYDSYTEYDYKKDLEEEKDLEQDDYFKSGFKV